MAPKRVLVRFSIETNPIPARAVIASAIFLICFARENKGPGQWSAVGAILVAEQPNRINSSLANIQDLDKLGFVRPPI